MKCGFVKWTEVVSLHKVFDEALPVCGPYFVSNKPSLHFFHVIVADQSFELLQLWREWLGMWVERDENKT